MFENILNKLNKNPIIPIIRENSFKDALNKSTIAIKNGLNIIEITYTTPKASQIISTLISNNKNILVGAGSIINQKDAKNAIASGAQFIVSPGFAKEVSIICKKKKILYIPGCLTPSEMMHSLNQGWHLIKLFPISFISKEYILTIVNAMPNLSFMATGGLSEKNIQYWMDSPITLFGIGSFLFKGTQTEIIKRIHTLKGLKQWNQK